MYLATCASTPSLQKKEEIGDNYRDGNVKHSSTGGVQKAGLQQCSSGW